ncbi:hypothetical protein [Epibacterium ulvae]|uniref:hypothetical protein n=1 Tax=Epibacterium ulvae TaxID=1156985 RepID=UPI0024924A5C|nr:hypothetical protein [Epibacterium ulvae]
MRKRDPNTLDMFTDWQPPEVAVNLPAEVTTGGTLTSQIARAVSRVLRECEQPRHEIAAAMSDYLGQDVTRNMLDAYASEAREGHKITFERALALMVVTGQTGLLGFASEMFDLIVVPSEYRELIELHFIEEQQKRLEAKRALITSQWKRK